MVNAKSKKTLKTYVSDEIWNGTAEGRIEKATSSDGMQRTVTIIRKGKDDDGSYILTAEYYYNLNQSGSLIKTGLRKYAQKKANAAIKFAGGNKSNGSAACKGIGYYFVRELTTITGSNNHRLTQAHCHEAANVVIYDYLRDKRNFSAATLKKILPLKFTSADGYKWAKKNDCWHSFSKQNAFAEYVPKLGDLLIFKRKEKSDTATHTELVIGYSQAKGMIYTYNFNSGSKLEVKSDGKTLKKNAIPLKTGRKNSSHYILGVIEVKYLSH